jgi:hypothetical protein
LRHPRMNDKIETGRRRHHPSGGTVNAFPIDEVT